MGDHAQTMMMVGGIGILCWLMLRGRIKARSKFEPTVDIPTLKHNANVQGSSGGFSGAASMGAPKEVLRWQVELFDLARQLKAELDSKISAVSKLTRDYDSAAERLNTMIAEARRLEQTVATPLQMARRMSRAGCSIQQISSSLDLSDEQVKNWLNADFPSTGGANRVVV